MSRFAMRPDRRWVLIAVLVLLVGLLLVQNLARSGRPATGNPELDHAHLLFAASKDDRRKAVEWIRDRGGQDMVAPLIYALRYLADPALVEALTALTGEEGAETWFQWMLWQQGHPEVMPFAGFDQFQSNLFAQIDPNFVQFLHSGVAHEIRLEEITWGGVQKDGIPALTSPPLILADEATYLTDEDLVFGVEINGDARAYPYRIMDWHEMFNDVVGGVPVSLAYCTLCGSGILFETDVEGRDAPFVFGSSGFLYRSNKLMYDQQTHSLWNQFTGRPVVGALTGSGIELKVRPVVTTTWRDWREGHPETRVLALTTGFDRDYEAGAAYGPYFSSPDLMFPAVVDDHRLQAKEQVFGLRISGAEKAWPLSAFAGGKVINDRVGIIQLVIVGNAESRTIRAYRSGGIQFEKSDDDLRSLRSQGADWQLTEDALIGPNGENLPRLPGHLAYWFAWSGYLSTAELGGG